MSLVTNKKATFNYDILEEFEAGIELHGFEVKALRNKQGSLEGSYVIIRGREAFLVNATIPPYQPKNTPDWYEPDRPRRLLLTKKELDTLIGSEKQKGLTLVPLSVYSKGRNIKLSFALARGKKKHDKREDIKRRDQEREIRRELKGR